MKRSPETHLPLKSDVFVILLILADGETYGYDIIQRAEEVSEGTVLLQAGALYRRLKWLLDEDLIEELDERAVDGDSDERRRYYALTAFGREVVRAEAERMRSLVGQARRLRLLPGESR